MHTNARRVVASLLAGLLVAVGGCAGRSTPAAPRLTIEPAPAPAPAPQPRVEETAKVEPAFDPATVVAAVRSVEPRAAVGALVVDRTSGAELLAIEPDRQFRSASLVKLLIAIDTLERGADPQTRKQIAIMLERSDDDIASSLWVAGHGPMIVTRTAGRLELSGTRAPRQPGRWGDVLLTAHDVAHIYEYVLTRLPDVDRELIVDALARAPRVAGDGFDQYFGIPDGLGGTWAIKQGWSNSQSNLVIHTSGLYGQGWPYVVVLLTEHPLGVPTRTATRSVTAGAKALSPLF
jgi:hypothetical protein